MIARLLYYIMAVMALTALMLHSIGARAESVIPTGKPAATIDLATKEGAQLVHGTWKYSDTRIIETDFKKAGADGQPSSETNCTYDYTPHAGGANFDDSRWDTIEADTLSQRRANGRLCFNWYRITITVPERVGDTPTAGTAVVFETSLDDYAEIWVNGELTRSLGQSGGSVIAGWNAENRLLVGRDVKPGQKIQLAVFGINGPISNPPTNYIYLRYARLNFYNASAQPLAITPSEVNVEVERLDSKIDALVPANPKIFKLAEGFQFTEGPAWIPANNPTRGYLLFSDPNANTMYKFTPEANPGHAPGGELEIFREKSGYDGADIAEYGQPGSNGITRDQEGRIVFCQHGNHAIVRLEKDGTLTTLANQYNGKRLNSPNDIVCKSDGAIYFTDPPYGLPKFFADPRKELDFSGIYRIKDGKVTLVSKDLGGPNGLAFSPDEKFFYVTNWDERVRSDKNPAARKKIVLRYEVQPDGTLKAPKVFFRMDNAPEGEALDGMKIDTQGNLYISGPGGVWILSAEGKHLGTIHVPQLPANLAWGAADGKSLYMTARTGLYRMRLNVPGIRP